MDAEGFARAVRTQLGLGRLLPLGDAADGAWLAESAAVAVLRKAVSEALPELRMEGLRLSAPYEAREPAVPPPPSALPPGPLHIDADFASPPHAPLTTTADLLRAALLASAHRELGLRTVTADLRVTDLLESGNGHEGDGARPPRIAASSGGPASAAAEGTGGGRHRASGSADGSGHGSEETASGRRTPAPADDPATAATAQAVISVPGVSRLAPVLGPGHGGLPADAVSVFATPGAAVGDGRTTRRHLRIQIAVAEGHRALDVARAVRHAARKAAAWDAGDPEVPVTVAVLVGAVDAPDQ